MRFQEVVLRPVVTEKSTIARELANVVTLAVNPSANKAQIKEAVESIWQVDVLEVRTSRMPRKTRRVGKFKGRKSEWKKAMVTLAEGQSVEFYEGV